MTRILKNNIAVLLSMVLCGSLHSQGFKNRAELGHVNKTGFYSIALTPALSSYVKTDFSDLRVLDEDGKQAAYIIKNVGGRSFTYGSLFKPLKIILNEQDDSGRTVVVIANNAAERINSIALFIRNASVTRFADISGSDDDKKWFSIEENVNLEKKYINDTDKYAETIDLPLASYRYIRLVIYNGKNDPLNIVAAGNYVHTEPKDVFAFMDNPAVSFVQKDSSDRYSYISVNSPMAFHINKMTLAVSGPQFFKRDIEIAVPYGARMNFALSSGTVFNFDIPVFKSHDWRIKIYNGDNPPLAIKRIATQQRSKNIIAWLDSGKTYHLEMNNATAIAPQYDLQNFKDSIPENVIPVSFSAIQPIIANNATANKTFFQQSWLWPVIMLVLIVLVFFTVKLVKEVGKGH